jgi:hypothetical protein
MRPAVSAFKKRYSHALLEAVDWAMEIDPLLRPQNVEQILDSLKDISTLVYQAN